MIRTALKTAFGHKGRLVGTATAVMIGVAFIAGTFIFTDTINNMFDELFNDIYAGRDIMVQQASEVNVGVGDPAPIDESIVDTVRSVPGVAGVRSTSSRGSATHPGWFDIGRRAVGGPSHDPRWPPARRAR